MSESKVVQPATRHARFHLEKKSKVQVSTEDTWRIKNPASQICRSYYFLRYKEIICLCGPGALSTPPYLAQPRLHPFCLFNSAAWKLETMRYWWKGLLVEGVGIPVWFIIMNFWSTIVGGLMWFEYVNFQPKDSNGCLRSVHLRLVDLAKAVLRNFVDIECSTTVHPDKLLITFVVCNHSETRASRRLSKICSHHLQVLRRDFEG